MNYLVKSIPNELKKMETKMCKKGLKTRKHLRAEERI